MLRAARNESGLRESYFLWRGAQDAGDYRDHAVPLGGFAVKPAFSGGGEPVEFRSAIIFRFAPLARNPALMFEPVKRRIERTLLNFQKISGDLLDAQQNAIAVQRAQRNGFEDQHFQRAAQQVNLFIQDRYLS